MLNFQLLIGQRVLPWDAMDEFYPSVFFNAHSIRLGLAPWWNPFIYSGYAQIGDPQGMLFSPLLMAWMLLQQAPSPIWFDWGVLLHLLLGGAAMLALLRRYGANALGALLGATVFMAGGVAASRLEHTPDVIAYAYAPIVLIELHSFLCRPNVLRGVLFGLAAGAMVTQLVQPTYLLVFVIVSYALAGTAWRWRHYTSSECLQWALGMAVAMGCALVIGLPQLLFSWAAVGLSNRSALPLEYTKTGSLDLRAFLYLFDANAFHGMQNVSTTNVVEAFLYIGVLPLAALFALPRVWRDCALRPVLVFFAAVALLACVYMLGTNTPVYGWLYTWLPGLVHFRRPSDAAFLVGLALSVLSGLAASRVNLQSRRELTTLLAITACWLALMSITMHDRHARPFLSVVVAGSALWQIRRPSSDWRVALWLMAVLVADYRSFNLNGTFNEMGNTVRDFAQSPAVQYLQSNLAQGSGALPGRITTLNTRTTWDNTVEVVGLPSTEGYNPLRYALYETLYAPRESSNVQRTVAPLNAPPGNTLDRLLAVQYLVIGHRKDLPPVGTPAGYEHVFSSDDVDIWRSTNAYPRVLTPTHARQYRVDQLPAAAEFAANDFKSNLLLTPRDAEDLAGDLQVAASCTGEVHTGPASQTPTRLKLSVTAPVAGWLVTGDLDYPGWIAEVDGRPVTIHRANGMFRAVCVPAGSHELQFTFKPLLLLKYAWIHRNAV